MCFPLNQNTSSQSAIVSKQFFQKFFCLYQRYLCSMFRRNFRIFSFFFFSVNTLCTEADYPWLIYKSIKPFESKTSIALNLAFPSNTVLSYFFFFFLIIDLDFLISAVSAQIFIPTADIAIPTKMPTNDINAEIETQPVTVELKILNSYT